jgi:type I restriction enzyme S subunit
MRRFTDYKDSGSDRIGYMPNHWTIRRINDIGAIQYGLGQPPEYKETGLPFVRATNVTKGKITDEGLVYVAAEDVTTSRNPLLRENDIIVVRSGANTADSALVPARYAGAVAGYDMVIRAKSIVPHYLSYSLLSSYLLESQLQLQSFRAAQPHLNKEQLGHALVLCPPLPEQQAIADYLDAKTAQIDRKIDLLTQKAAKYRQLKQALINAAVTQGLDQSAPMKDSGVEWIGAVPAHWEIARFKDLFGERNEKGHPNEPLLIASQDKGVTLKSFYDRRTMSVQKDFHLMKLVKPGDYVISLRSFEGGIEFAFYQGIISAAYTVIYPIEQNGAGFYSHLFKSAKFISVLASCTTGIREGRNVSYQQLKRELIAVPNAEERQSIADYLDTQTAKIDSIVVTLSAQIGKLQDLRKSLINDVVTGKLRVT